MTKTAVLLGGDRRQSCLARQLQACGFAVRTCGVPGCPDTAHTLPACVWGAELLILPMPALRAPDRIRAVPDDLPLGPALDAAAPDALVCGGLLDAAVPALQAHSPRWFDYARDETLALENAELTAEAALPPLLARLPCPLRGSRILILGFGRIGKRLAWKLHTLGAAVTVAARRPEALALARILGLQAEPLGPQLQGLAVYDAVVNTVPAPVICDAQLSAIRPDAALLELASLPGGFCPPRPNVPGISPPGVCQASTRRRPPRPSSAARSSANLIWRNAHEPQDHRARHVRLVLYLCPRAGRLFRARPRTV